MDRNARARYVLGPRKWKMENGSPGIASQGTRRPPVARRVLGGRCAEETLRQIQQPASKGGWRTRRCGPGTKGRSTRMMMDTQNSDSQCGRGRGVDTVCEGSGDACWQAAINFGVVHTTSTTTTKKSAKQATEVKGKRMGMKRARTAQSIDPSAACQAVRIIGRKGGIAEEVSFNVVVWLGWCGAESHPMSSLPNAPSPIQFAQKYFSMLAPSLKDIRNIRSNVVQAACSTCLMSEKDLGQQLRKCGKCHAVWYCSKECQTQSWPDHKPTCREGGIPKLIRTLISNELLQDILHVCFILDFNLLHRSTFDEPLLARVDVAIEPSDIHDFAEILLGKGLDQKKLQGMLQVNRFQPATAEQLENLPQHREMWRRARERVDSKGFRTDPVALMVIDFACGLNSIAVPVHIHSLAMDVLKKQILAGFNSISSAHCVPYRYAYFTHHSNGFMNTHIRADKENQLLLRTEIRPSDVQVIRDVAANSNSVPAMMLNNKLAREKIYQRIYEELLKRRKAACEQVGQ
ncbi:hypothetical protein C8F04DRAFT_1232481 [Mycena alexandri]|uniref:MYND-type domain-containing protein n=1 Tax=Mycena alexandri TaxID=1745969 RepID=A0AAD6X7C4_9AGAR|nr:hypothetical protein C8F04DRAFT_1232481 [Mycena alexandri]